MEERFKELTYARHLNLTFIGVPLGDNYDQKVMDNGIHFIYGSYCFGEDPYTGRSYRAGVLSQLHLSIQNGNYSCFHDE